MISDQSPTGADGRNLDHLKGMKDLRMLGLELTKVTAAGLAAVRKALPQFQVSGR